MSLAGRRCMRVECKQGAMASHPPTGPAHPAWPGARSLAQAAQSAPAEHLQSSAHQVPSAKTLPLACVGSRCCAAQQGSRT